MCCPECKGRTTRVVNSGGINILEDCPACNGTGSVSDDALVPAQIVQDARGILIEL